MPRIVERWLLFKYIGGEFYAARNGGRPWDPQGRDSRRATTNDESSSSLSLVESMTYGLLS